MNLIKIMQLVKKQKSLQGLYSTMEMNRSHLDDTIESLRNYANSYEQILKGNEGYTICLSSHLVTTAEKASNANHTLWNLCCVAATALKNLGVNDPCIDF